MGKNQTIAIVILSLFTLATIMFGLLADKIGGFIQNNHSLFFGLLIYYFSNITYLLIIFGVIYYHKHIYLRAFIASIFIIIALDIVSLPHCVSFSGLPDVLANGCATATIGLSNMVAGNYACSDTIIIRWFFEHGMPFKLIWALYYIVSPLIFGFLSLLLLGYNAFVRETIGVGGMNG